MFKRVLCGGLVIGFLGLVGIAANNFQDVWHKRVFENRLYFDGTRGYEKALKDISALTLGANSAVTALTVSGPSSFTGTSTFTGSVICTAEQLTAGTTGAASAIIDNGITNAEVIGTTTDANDWIILPTIGNVPVGYQVRIACNAGSDFELRTTAASNVKINTVDADGTNEFYCTDTHVILATKVSDTDGWQVISLLPAGGINSPTVPN